MHAAYFHVDAFTQDLFGGNPAGVCILDTWPEDGILQQIAAENNLSETAFLEGSNGHWNLRWFTPTTEVDLCGHATLAAAFVIYTELKITRHTIEFESASGGLTAPMEDGVVMLDFPSRPGVKISAPDALIRGLGLTPEAVLKSRDYLAVLGNEPEVRNLIPDFESLAELDCLGIIATAPGNDVDFVSRFFAPRAGIPEDPVTGSAHCTLIPYWAERLGKERLIARQLSRRGGTLHCQIHADRVSIGGHAMLYSRAEIAFPG